MEEFLFPTTEVPLNVDPLELLIVGPVIEEFYFQSVFQTELSWIVSDKYAIVLSSGLFAFAHWMPGLPIDIALIVRLCSGLFFGIAYSKTRNILVSYVSHFGVNLWGLFPT